jgi:hypothetical protein
MRCQEVLQSLRTGTGWSACFKRHQEARRCVGALHWFEMLKPDFTLVRRAWQ